MCIRRSSRHPRNKHQKDGGTQTGANKLTCCQRCMRKIRRWICRRISRCLKKKMFGTPDPRLEHYEIAGLNLSSIKSKLNPTGKKSVVTLFRKHLRPSKLTLKNIDLIEGLSAKDLKNKFSITGSKQKVLDYMVDDYKTGKLSLSRLPNSSKFDARELDKDQMKKMLEDYEVIQKRIKDNSELNAEDIKNKFSISGSKGKILDKMVADYKKGKGSATGLSVKSKFDPNKFNKEQINDMLKKYETVQKDKKRMSFLGQSKNKLMNIIDEVKYSNISFSGLPKNWFK